MKNSTLMIVGKCLLRFEQQKNEFKLFCNGFNNIEALFLISELDKIALKKISLESGIGDSYRYYTEKDFLHVNMLSDLKDSFDRLPKDIFIYALEIISEEMSISIYEDEFNISYRSHDINVFMKFLKQLISKSFLFPDEICSQLINTLIANEDKYVSIDEKANIVKIYESFDDYISDELT